MKRGLVVGVLILVATAAGWAAGQKEVSIEGPPYDVSTVKAILGSEELYQQGYLQREMDQNRDGINDETGNRIYAGALKDYEDSNGDGLDDATGGELPLGRANRLIDRNGDGVVDDSAESVGQYVNRVRIEARQRYEDGEGTSEHTRTRTTAREGSGTAAQTRTQTQSTTSNGAASGAGSSGQSRHAR